MEAIAMLQEIRRLPLALVIMISMARGKHGDYKTLSYF
jgi:hypothetical protein